MFLPQPKATVLLTLTLVLGACSAEPDNTVRRQHVVQIVANEVSYRTDRITVEAVGTARARAFAEIFPDTGGEVTAVEFEAGQKVGANDVLLRLDARAERLAVERARVAVKNAEQILGRFQQLESPGAVSASQLDEAQIALDGARIDLQLAQVTLEDRTVRAPFSGYVGLTDIDTGARITTQTIITQLDDRDVLFVDFDAPEQVFGRVAPGDSIPMAPFSAPAQPYDAVVSSVDSRVNATSRSFRVRARVDNARDELRPGMSFRIGFELPGEAYPAVPEAAIVWGGDGAYLWAVQGGKATRVPVTIVSRQDGLVLVRAPIPEGALIVAEGVQKVREGAVVNDPAFAEKTSGDETPTTDATTDRRQVTGAPDSDPVETSRQAAAAGSRQS
ncbi:MAG: efflux RND transporter periplasmic adaptor subunit [Pseudomonadota bacterium]